MTFQYQKKELLAEFFFIFECLLTQNSTNQDSQLSSFFHTIWKTIKNPKTGAFRELFLPEMI